MLSTLLQLIAAAAAVAVVVLVVVVVVAVVADTAPDVQSSPSGCSNPPYLRRRAAPLRSSVQRDPVGYKKGVVYLRRAKPCQ